MLPQSLFRAFVHEPSYPLIENEYRNGESQRSVQPGHSRNRWLMAKRLTASQLGELRDFCEARGGTNDAFYFYNPYETNANPSYDASKRWASPPKTQSTGARVESALR